MFLICVASFIFPAYSKQQVQGIITSIMTQGIPAGVDKDGHPLIVKINQEEADKAIKVVDVSSLIMDSKQFDFTKQTILRA